MDGRRRSRWTAVGLMAAALTGCNRNETLPNEHNPPLPGAEKKDHPDVSKYFGGKPPSTVGAPSMDSATAKPKRKAGEPLKPETEVALAETELEAAFAEDRTAVERDQLIDSARQRYQRAIKAQPKYQDALIGLARLYTTAGDKDRAVETYRTAMKAAPKDHALVHKLAATQAKFGDWTGAVESCRLALTMDPENRTYQKTLGFCQAHGGRWDEAHETMARLMPEADARYFLGRVLYDQDKPADAKQQMEMALQADPQYAKAKQFLTDLDAGQAVPHQQGGVQTVGYSEPAAQPSAP